MKESISSECSSGLMSRVRIAEAMSTAIERTLLFHFDLLVGTLQGLRGLFLRLGKDFFLPFLRTPGRILEHLRTLLGGVGELLLVVGLHLGGSLFVLIRVGVHFVNFLLAGIDHLLHGLEQQLLHHKEQNHEVAQRENACPQLQRNKVTGFAKQIQ